MTTKQLDQEYLTNEELVKEVVRPLILTFRGAGDICVVGPTSWFRSAGDIGSTSFRVVTEPVVEIQTRPYSDSTLLFYKGNQEGLITLKIYSDNHSVSSFRLAGDTVQSIETLGWIGITSLSHLVCSLDYNFPLNHLDVSSVTDMSHAFSSSCYNQHLNKWDVSAVANMSDMFLGSQFNQPIGNWDVSSVTNMSYMFTESVFNQPIGDWDVSSVTTMKCMFSMSEFNQPIGNWNVSSVMNMSLMFQDSQYNQPIDDRKYLVPSS